MQPRSGVDQRPQVADDVGRHPLAGQQRRHAGRITGDRLGRDPADRLLNRTASLIPRNASRGDTAGSASRSAGGWLRTLVPGSGRRDRTPESARSNPLDRLRQVVRDAIEWLDGLADAEHQHHGRVGGELDVDVV